MIFALNADGAAGFASFLDCETRQVLEEDCITEEELAMEELAGEMSLSMSYFLETGRNLRGANVRRRKTVREVLN